MRRLSKQPVERDLYRAPVYRDSADLLKRQADLLAGVDRTLVMMYVQAGCNFHQLGRLTGMNRSSVARRIRRILRRLSDHTYLVCLENRSKFTDLELAVLRDHLVRGQSLARIAREHAVCYYRARVILQKARAVVRNMDGLAEEDSRQVKERGREPPGGSLKAEGLGDGSLAGHPQAALEAATGVESTSVHHM